MNKKFYLTINKRFLLLSFYLIAWFLNLKNSYPFDEFTNDTLVMRNGTKRIGFIIKNSEKSILFSEDKKVSVIKKSDILRIYDEGNAKAYFRDIVKPGMIPHWQMIIQDMRTNDDVRSLYPISPIAVNHGLFRNIPYLSFRVNKDQEIHCYGNPADPVCIEMGSYAKGKALELYKKKLRCYLSGFFLTNSEIKVIYSLKNLGDEKSCYHLNFLIEDKPENSVWNGGWWLAVYKPNKLDSCRLSDKVYSSVTEANRFPMKNSNFWLSQHKRLRANMLDRMIKDKNDTTLYVGFYRNILGELDYVNYTSHGQK